MNVLLVGWRDQQSNMVRRERVELHDEKKKRTCKRSLAALLVESSSFCLSRDWHKKTVLGRFRHAMGLLARCQARARVVHVCCSAVHIAMMGVGKQEQEQEQGAGWRKQAKQAFPGEKRRFWLGNWGTVVGRLKLEATAASPSCPLVLSYF